MAYKHIERINHETDVFWEEQKRLWLRERVKEDGDKIKVIHFLCYKMQDEMVCTVEWLRVEYTVRERMGSMVSAMWKKMMSRFIIKWW